MELRTARKGDPALFLRELRALRNQAGLGHAELAARAHYPCDVIRAAEAGPSLPDLPVLSAIVRACGGTMSDWEERWRSVSGSPASPLLPTRAAGYSEAANAGARVGAAAVPADAHDPDRVLAALNRVADGMAASTSSPAPSGTNGSDALAGTFAASAAWDLDHPVADDAAWQFDPAADEAAWDMALKAEQPAGHRAPPARTAPTAPAARPARSAPAAPRPAASAPAAPAAKTPSGATSGTAQVGATRRLVVPGVMLAVLIVVTLAMVVLVLVATAHIFG
jgi:hypothetical protein